MTISQSYFEERPERMVCSIQDIREQDGDYGNQIVVEVLPVGESVARPIFFTASTSPRSKWIKWLKAWQDVGIKPEGPDDLIDTIVMLEQVVQSYTIEGESVDSTFWKPVKTYDSEADAMPDADRLRQGATPSVEESMESDAVAPEGPAEITDDLVEEARGVYEALGSDDEKFMSVAESSYEGYDLDALLEAVKE